MTVYEEFTEITLPLRSDADVLKARYYGAMLSASIRWSTCERAKLAIVILEIARNTTLYAANGCMLLKVVHDGPRRGLLVVVQDEGPGIANLDLAMQDGYTTSQGLGVGLPSAKRLMDEFEISSEVGKGTKITMRKWEK